jgi:anti-sigma factor RsiW
MTGIEGETEQLEMFLDRGLTAGEQAALEARLRQDPALADAIDELRSQRMTRLAVWRSLEPSDREIDHLAATITSAARRDELRRRRAVALKWVSAAAASILLGIGAGWFGRAVMAPPEPATSVPVATAPAEDNLVRVAITDESGNVLAVQKFDSIDRAREFTRDVRQWQQRQRQVQDGNMILVGDRF